MDVATRQGPVRGIETQGVFSFRGVPYAAKPAGAGRFVAPMPPPVRGSRFDAIEFGPTVSTPPQRSPVMDHHLPDPVIGGSGSPLNLNIWTPDPSGALPVFVWIHGGGFVTGAGAVSAYDGTAFARDGVVAVTINYRLAAEGFLSVPGAPANRGLLDQIAALEWIRDNIGAFGGDPNSVTVAGESAGGMSVATLLAMPSASGLFHRAIVQSGTAHHVHTRADAELVSAELATELGVELVVDALASVPVSQLHAATNAVISRMSSGKDPRWARFDRLVMQPVIDGDVLPEAPIDAITRGISADVPLLVGTNSNEYGLFTVPTGVADTMDWDALRFAITRLGIDADEMIDAYRALGVANQPAELFAAIQSDWFCVMPTDRLVEARRGSDGSTYVYEFSWNPATFGGRMGACHTLEIPFVFHSLDSDWGAELRGEAPVALADEMHGAWVRFVRVGEPGWPSYDSERAVRILNVSSTTAIDPRARKRGLWDSVL